MKPSTAPTATSTPTLARPGAYPPGEPLVPPPRPSSSPPRLRGRGGECEGDAAGEMLTESEAASVGTISGTAGADAFFFKTPTSQVSAFFFFCLSCV